jgi:hypothetical protein
MRFFLFLAVGLFLSFPVQAQMTGERLYYLCSGALPEDTAACQGYLAGIMDYHTILRSVDMTPGVDFCVPKTVPADQLQLDVVTYFSQNKQHAEFLASPAIALAFSTLYPCP